MTTTCDRSALVADIRSRYPASHGLTLSFGDCRMRVDTNDPDLTAALKEYFTAFVCDDGPAHMTITAHEAPEPDLSVSWTLKDPEPGKSKIKEEYADIPGGRIVRKRLTGMVFIFGQGENVAVGPCKDNPNQVINFVNNRYIEHKLSAGCLLGHAAGVMHNNRGLALAGFSGMGKSTLALHLLTRGTRFVSNDRLMVEQGENALVMHGVAKHPRINPGTALSIPDLNRIMTPEEIRHFSEMPAEKLWEVEHKYDARVDEIFGPDKLVLDAPFSGLVILNWHRDADTPMTVAVVNPAERLDLLAAFSKSPGLFYTPRPPACRQAGIGARLSGAAHHGQPRERPALAPQGQSAELTDYAALLSHAVVAEFSGGVDFAAAARACMEFLETGRFAPLSKEPS